MTFHQLYHRPHSVRLPPLASLVGPVALFAELLFAAAPALAQASPRSAPVGGRSALMGGTGVALARDGAAPFLNPATIIHIDDSGLAFSVNFYTAQWANLSGFHQPGAGAGPSLPNTSLDTTRADALPSTLCLFLTIGDWGDNRAKTEEAEVPGHRKGRRKLAACLAQPERSQFSATAVGYAGQAGSLSASQGTSIQRSWNRLYVGPSYSIYVSDRIALGAALNGIRERPSRRPGRRHAVHAGRSRRLGVDLRHRDDGVLGRSERGPGPCLAHRRRPGAAGPASRRRASTCSATTTARPPCSRRGPAGRAPRSRPRPATSTRRSRCGWRQGFGVRPAACASRETRARTCP